MTINRFPPYYDLCLRCREKGLDNVADFIHELYADRDRLREALKQFCDSYEPHLSPERCQHCSEAYWEARAALKEDK